MIIKEILVLNLLNFHRNKKEISHDSGNVSVLTSILLADIEPSFCKASFKSPLPLMVGSLYTPSAATKIVI
jgi:hypothetical protein